MKTIDNLSTVDDKLLDPTQLTYRLKKDIRNRIQDALEKENGDEKTKESLRAILETEEENKQSLSYESLTSLHKNLQRLDPGYNIYFFELLDMCRAVVPNERQNKELDARLKRLQFEASGKSYNQMAANLQPKSLAASINLSGEMRQLRPILITLVNSILVILGSFFFVYKAVEYSMTEPDVVVQVLASLIAASIVAIAELYFLIKII